jgi:glyoxylate reductase
MGSSWTVAVTRKIPDAGLEPLREVTEVKLWDRELPPSPEELDALLEGCDGAITLLTDRIDGSVLDRHPSLRVISNFAVGYDNIDVPAATEHSVLVCNTPEVLTNATADHTWALLLAAARRIPESMAYVREGKWKTWGPLLLLGREVSGATIGIVGLGRIGKEVAKRARGFDMRVLAFDPFEDAAFAREHQVTYVPLEQLLKESDFVTLHVALTPETEHLIGVAELDAMKPTAILVNASRGPVVDTDALVEALRSGRINAAVDVTEPEPLPAGHPLWERPNLLLTPHVGGSVRGFLPRAYRLAGEQLRRFVAGEPLVNEVTGGY